MNALEALKIARENPGMLCKPKASTAYLRYDEKKKAWYTHPNTSALGGNRESGLTLDMFINPDGSPVEWEVIREEEL